MKNRFYNDIQSERVDVYTFVNKQKNHKNSSKQTPKTVFLYMKEHVCAKEIVKFRVGYEWVLCYNTKKSNHQNFMKLLKNHQGISPEMKRSAKLLSIEEDKKNVKGLPG